MTNAAVRNLYQHHRFCITGGTGSLGRTLARYLLENEKPARLAILSRDELKQAQMSEELAPLDENQVLRFFIGDVRDPARLREAFWNIDTVIHAAALKRIEAGVYNYRELIKTNVIGTQNVIDAALEAGVRRVLLISSDKAVQATNLYGGTKYLAEHIAVSSNTTTWPRGTAVAASRYGNVLGSRGSVLHIWRKQAVLNSPLSITDERMTRFIITLPQAARFVYDCLNEMEGGEIFVPVIPAARMVDLAEAYAPGHPRIIVGARPGGEKLHEELLSIEESTRTLLATDRLIITPAWRSWSTKSYAGRPLGPDVGYSSETVGLLTIPQLKTVLESVTLE